MKIAEPPEPDIAESLTRLALVEDSRTARDYAPFRLLNVLPQPGMIYHTHGRNRKKRLLSNRYQDDNMVERVLWKDMPDVGEHKAAERDKLFKCWAEQLIIPVFDHAKRLVENGHLPSAREGHIEESEAKDAFDKLIQHLHMQSTVRWARSLSLEHFVQFFSVLATARDEEMLFPQHDGEPRGLLVNCITGFLEEGARAGTSWSLTWGMGEDR